MAAYPIFVTIVPCPTRRFYAWVCCSCFHHFIVRVNLLFTPLQLSVCAQQKLCLPHSLSLSLSVSAKSIEFYLNRFYPFYRNKSIYPSINIPSRWMTEIFTPRDLTVAIPISVGSKFIKSNVRLMQKKDPPSSPVNFSYGCQKHHQ